MLSRSGEIYSCKIFMIFPCGFIISMGGIFLCTEKAKVHNPSIDTNICPILTTSMKAYPFIAALIRDPDNLIAGILFSGSYP